MHIMTARYGMKHVCRSCGLASTFHRIRERRAFACSHCGNHVYPTAGSVFQDTRTPLQSWFYAIYLFVATRQGVSGKELQRQLGVTYKTAYRLRTHMRKLIGSAQNHAMGEGQSKLPKPMLTVIVPASAGAAARTSVSAMKRLAARSARP